MNATQPGPEPVICVVIPVFNHGLTIQRVVAGAKREFPVIVVDDGSTDQTPAILAGEKDITVVTLPQNRGKAAALRAGFAKAGELGFTHAITIDADGQHPVGALPDFARVCRSNPEAFIIGVRNLKAAGAPLPRRLSNALSTFWFKFETGVRLDDTQCGFRVYPLERIGPLAVRSSHYAYELEVMVKAAWAGIPLIAQPVQADYAGPTSQLSHFHPWKDFVRIARVHSRLSTQAFCVPPLLRRLSAQGMLRELPRRQRVRTVLRHLYSENTETAARLAAAVGVGLFCGIAPIWGAQMLAAAMLAHKFRLNKAIAVTASNVSFPLAAPFILAAGLILGNFLWTGQWMRFEAHVAAQQIPLYLCQWLVGSLVLATLAGVAGAAVAFAAARAFRGRERSGE
jgi:glycosyltransferase involved in cell wall biosynthesis